MTLPDDINFLNLYQAGYVDHWQYRGLIKSDGVNRFHAFVKGTKIQFHYDIVKQKRHLKKTEFKYGHKIYAESKIKAEISRIRKIKQENLKTDSGLLVK